MATPSFLTDEHIASAVAIGLLIGGAMVIAELLTVEEMVNRVEFL